MTNVKITIPQAQIADFCRRNQIRQLALFGSVLRDDFGPESDVDILVDFESDARIGFMALGRMRRELSALLKRPVDLVPHDGLKSQLRESVLSTIEVLYAT